MINSCRSSDYELSGKIKFVQPSIGVVSYLIIRVGSSTSLPFYRDERSSFNWPIRHPTTNLIINVERETYRGWLLHANDSHFNAYCSPQTFQGDILRQYSKELEFVIIIIIVVTSKEKLIPTAKKCTRDRDERFRKSR